MISSSSSWSNSGATKLSGPSPICNTCDILGLFVDSCNLFGDSCFKLPKKITMLLSNQTYQCSTDTLLDGEAPHMIRHTHIIICELVSQKRHTSSPGSYTTKTVTAAHPTSHSATHCVCAHITTQPRRFFFGGSSDSIESCSGASIVGLMQRGFSFRIRAWAQALVNLCWSNYIVS